MMSAWSEIHGSLEIKEIMPVPYIKRNYASALDCGLQSCGLAWPMSCGQMRLIQVSAHVQKYTTSWIIEAGEMCFIFLNVMGYYMQKITIHGNIYIGINLWITCG